MSTGSNNTPGYSTKEGEKVNKETLLGLGSTCLGAIFLTFAVLEFRTYGAVDSITYLTIMGVVSFVIGIQLIVAFGKGD